MATASYYFDIFNHNTKTDFVSAVTSLTVARILLIPKDVVLGGGCAYSSNGIWNTSLGTKYIPTIECDVKFKCDEFGVFTADSYIMPSVYTNQNATAIDSNSGYNKIVIPLIATLADSTITAEFNTPINGVCKLTFDDGWQVAYNPKGLALSNYALLLAVFPSIFGSVSSGGDDITGTTVDLTAVTDMLSTVLSNISDLSTDMSSVITSSESASNGISTLLTNLATANTNISSIKTDVTAIKGYIPTDLTTRLTNIANAISSLGGTVSGGTSGTCSFSDTDILSAISDLSTLLTARVPDTLQSSLTSIINAINGGSVGSGGVSLTIAQSANFSLFAVGSKVVCGELGDNWTVEGYSSLFVGRDTTEHIYILEKDGIKIISPAKYVSASVGA